MVIASLLCITLAHQHQQQDFSDAITESREAMKWMIQEKRAPGGAIAVSVSGKIAWSEGFGHSDLENNKKVNAQTLFGIGSISKSLTMACVARLVDKRVLDWDAPLETYLPDFPFRGKNITLRLIGCHQSGLSDDFAKRNYWTTDSYSVKSTYQELKKEKVVYEPGTKSEYATGLFGYVASVIEEATGKPFLAVMKKEVLDPAGMKSTRVNDPSEVIPNKTQFYMDAEGGGFKLAPRHNPSHKLAGAGLLSTASDLARFGSALASGDLLSKSARAELWKRVPLKDGSTPEFAQGFRIDIDEGRPVAHQPGGGPGISAWLFIYPEQQMAIAIVSNIPTGPVGGRPYVVASTAFLKVIERLK